MLSKYRLPKKSLRTQYRTLMMLLTTLSQVFEHIIQHLFRSITAQAVTRSVLVLEMAWAKMPP
jgi:hypothetical protein